jgi:hypothetical protein
VTRIRLEAWVHEKMEEWKDQVTWHFVELGIIFALALLADMRS